ncbi:MAG: UxaA family hydrolase [Verrucomicrobia bacterium]|nr:UxaA family hydrolase [Verrucomicrobiota bacterium]
MKKCFQVNLHDNVATVLENAGAELIQVVGGGTTATLQLRGGIKLGHKVALARIKAGEGILKYGVRIGHATRNLRRGEWVHLHNCASDFDKRSNTLDCETGAPTDTKYE